MSYVVTLAFDAESFARLDALRREHFPPDRNFLAAHLTLFHQLPEDPASRVAATLAATATAMPPFALEFRTPVLLGRGVAIAAQAPELGALRAGLAERFGDFLTRQDAGGFRPHVTLQNKVSPEAARALHERLLHEWRPLRGRAEGISLWRYLGGPWEPISQFPFHAPLV